MRSQFYDAIGCFDLTLEPHLTLFKLDDLF